VDLERLIATEQRLDEALRSAREQAAGMVAEAQSRARREETALDAELEAATRTLAVETAAERERGERQVAAEAAAQVARYEAVRPDQVAGAARDVVDWLVGRGEA
jgi:vacuolar-type H+-ATPase subunit H